MADEKITSDLKEQYALTDGDEVLAQVWFSDIDSSSAETEAPKATGIPTQPAAEERLVVSLKVKLRKEVKCWKRKDVNGLHGF